MTHGESGRLYTIRQGKSIENDWHVWGRNIEDAGRKDQVLK